MTIGALGSAAGGTEAGLLRASDSLALLGERLGTQAETTRKHVIWIVLGFREGAWGWVPGVLAIMFVVYNILRAVVTWWMAQVRDAEERSGHLPEIQDYWWCYSLHRIVLRPIFMVAVASFGWHIWLWMSETVDVPIQYLH